MEQFIAVLLQAAFAILKGLYDAGYLSKHVHDDIIQRLVSATPQQPPTDEAKPDAHA